MRMGVLKCIFIITHLSNLNLNNGKCCNYYHWHSIYRAPTVTLLECEAQRSTLATLGESLVLVAAWSRQEGTAGGFFWISSLKQVDK